ncbi:MAG: alpha/beta fold hydrolase [Chloroflexi bacterium]|nr:alpha/beta fold hydrolase [Chloroflexota bacterium]MCI0580672.1 alpha/beta fold hydrolase [Chloroflexota bacterium]MCI0648688.1 alpha/beta fold hydrolase [Chloroflexota bacterium]MCI0728096.1 alpha/beta fold hydrolase [Chloroflexota bacterium]
MPFQPSYDVSEERQAYTMLAGPVGCLMLHGFMGSPISSRPLAGYLSERGITMHCPLLPGHGHLPEKLYKIPRQAWIAEAREALAFIRQHCDEIFLMGHSMGTVLAAHLIGQNPDIRGLVMLAPLDDVPDGRIRWLRFLRYAMPWFYPWQFKRLRSLVQERVKDFDPTLDLHDPAVQARLVQMTRVPTSGMDEMRRMADLGRQLWPRLHLPVLIFQGGRDVAVSPGNAEKIYNLLPGQDKELKFFPDAGHELMRPFDPTHEEVWPTIFEFIRSRSRLSESEKALAGGTLAA